MDKLVIFKKKDWEIANAYSLVNDEILESIPHEIILKIIPIEGKIYSPKQLDVLVMQNV